MQFFNQLSRILICYLCFLSTQTLFAQQTFVEGYYISNDGDTTKGYIQADTDLALKNRFIFSKYQDGSQKESILVDEANSFRAADYFFERISIEEKKFYARQLIDGYLKLYKSYDGPNEIEYYIKYKGRFIQLNEVEKTFVDPKKGRVKKVSSTYKNILNYVFNDCPDFDKEKQLRYITLRESSLVNVITAFNYCIDPRISSSIINKRRSITRKSYLMVGFQSTPSQSIGNNPGPYEIVGQGFSFGYNLEINSEETNRKNFAFLTGIEYRSTSYELTDLDINPTQVEERDIGIIQIPMLGKVNFSAKSPVFFDFGLNLYYRTSTYRDVLGTMEFPITLGLGAEIDRVKVESRLESNWPTSSTNFGNSIEYIRFLLSYRVNRNK